MDDGALSYSAHREPRPSPNRYASGPEAAILGAQIASNEADLALAKQRAAEARIRLDKTTASVRAAEQALLEAREADSSALLGYECAQRQMAILETNIQSFKALMHPIRKAPLEILSLIFEALSDQLQCRISISNYAEAQKVAFVLAAVCQKWRSAATSSTVLWHRVVFEFSSAVSLSSTAWTAYFKAHLLYSGGRPLQLFLIHGNTHSCSPSYEPVYRGLRNLVARAAVVRVAYSADGCDQFHSFIKRTSAPELKQATFETLFPPATTPHIFDLFHGMRSVCSLKLVHCMPRWKPSIFPAVTKIDGTWTNIRANGDIREMLLAAPGLRDLTLKATKIVDDAAPPNGGPIVGPIVGGPIAALYLRDFALAVDILPDRLALSFRFPSLRSMKLHFPRYSDSPARNFPTPRRLSLIATPCPTIKSLRIDATKCDERLVLAMAQLKQLEVVEMHNCWLHTNFFTRLMQPLDDGSPVCPQLTSLAFSACNLHAGFDEEAPVLFARSRWTPVSNGPKRCYVRVVVHGDTPRPAFIEKLTDM